MSNWTPFVSVRWGMWWGFGLVTWLAAVLLGLPAPHADDLFFTGTAVSLASGGGLRNPWIEAWLSGFGQDAFYAQPPLHPYLLATWLRVFGVSSGSILAFQNIAVAVSALLAAALAKGLGASRLGALISGTCVATVLLTRGLRPEAWGVAALLGAAHCWGDRSRWLWATGCFLAAVAVALHPFAAAVAVPGGVVALHQRASKANARELYWSAGVAALAAIAVVLLVVALVDFNVSTFWRTFREHAAQRTPKPGTRWVSLLSEMTIGHELWLKGPALAGAAAITLAALCRGDRPRATQALVLQLGLIFIGVALYAGHVPVWLWPLSIGCSLVLWPSLTLNKPRAHGWGTLALGLATVWGLAPWLIAVASARGEPQEVFRELRAKVEASRGNVLLIDEVATRFVFDFRPPATARDWLLNRKLRRGMQSYLADKPHGEAWVVGERTLELYVPDAGVRPTRAHIGSISGGAWLLNPERVHFYP